MVKITIEIDAVGLILGGRRRLMLETVTADSGRPGDRAPFSILDSKGQPYTERGQPTGG